MELDKLYDNKKHEKEYAQQWEDGHLYKFDPKSEKKLFSIDTPPPTVSGALHVGHVFSYTHQDLIARYKRMRGYNVFYPMGFDDNGLASERFVEKKNNTKAHLMSRSDFIKLCAQETALVEKDFEALWKSLGLSIDWTNVYSTISPRVRKISQYSFIDLFKKKLAFRKQDPALYCTTCRTSVAQAELDSAEVSTNFNDILFTTQDGESLTIATTRPELLPACVAVFFHPNDGRYAHLAGKNAIVPVFNTAVPLLTDDKVDPEKGSGLVMCCTFGDQTDIFWFKKHKLPFIQVVGHDGKWTDKAGVLAGLTVHEARKKIIELLKQEQKLLGQKSIVHSVSTHERCKQEIEYLVLSQWFINILDHKEKFLELGDEINWHPAFMKARYRDWVEHLNWDWCISRQRFFGIPFPVWHCQDCSHIILADIKDLPIDPQEQEYPGKICPSCKGTNLKPDTDVMDTWNTSGLTPQINSHWPEETRIPFPFSMRASAHDIIRTWAFYTIVKAYYHQNTIPWTDIVISGHVLAGKEKISKSKENSKMSPEFLLSEYPADVIRYWSANGKLGTDTAFSENQLKIGHRLVTKIWNAFRFFSERLETYKKPTQGLSSQAQQQEQRLDDLNKWVLHNLSLTIEQYIKHFDNFEYQSALEVTEKFFWSIFCDNYLELVKDRFFTPDAYLSEIIEATTHTLYQTGFGILQLFAPFMPFVTETLYQQIYKSREGTKSLHITQLDQKQYTCDYKESVQTIDLVIKLVNEVRKLKSESKVSLKTPIKQLVLHTQDKNIQDSLASQERLIAGITKAEQISYLTKDIETSNAVSAEEQNLVLWVKI